MLFQLKMTEALITCLRVESSSALKLQSNINETVKPIHYYLNEKKPKYSHYRILKNDIILLTQLHCKLKISIKHK